VQFLKTGKNHDHREAYGKSPTVHNIATPMRDISDQVKKKYPPLLFTFKEAK